MANAIRRSLLTHMAGATIFVAALTACGGDNNGAEPASDMKTAADTVFTNGRIYTVDGANRVVEAIAIKDGKIAALGGDAEIGDFVAASTQVIDLDGRMLLPGLIDAHMHPLGAGNMLTTCSLKYESLTVAEILSRITACLEAEPDAASDKWLHVQAWFRQATKPEGADLSAEILDRLPTDRPVVVMANDYHTLAANSAAMRAAGIDDDTADPAGGKIVRDESGAATGIFLDAAMGVVAQAEPPLPEKEQEEKNLKDLSAALSALNEQGVTTMFDAAGSESSMKAAARLREEGELSVRSVISIVASPDAANTPKEVVATLNALGGRYNTPVEAQSPGITVDRAKMFVDGVIQAPAQTGALHEPYLHNTGTAENPVWEPGENSGSLYYDEALLTGMLDELVSNGLSAHMHTDGDKAVTVALNAIETVRAKHNSPAYFRPGLAHDELLIPTDYPRFSELNAIPVLSLQWGKPAPDTIDSVKNQIGPERFPYLETAGKFQEAGARVAFGSDWPVEALDEWRAMQIGVTRSNPDAADPKYQGRLGDDPGLDVETAIRAFTINAAYSLNMEDYVGSLEEGKFADLIVIDRDITAVPPETIAETKVLMTMIGGKEVYRADSF